MSPKAIYIISLLLAIGISVPLAQSFLSDMTTTGGLIQVATNATAASTVAGGTLNADWELAIWRLMPFIFLIMAIVLFVKAIARRDEPER